MKAPITICVAMAMAFSAKAQYVPATVPETLYSSLNFTTRVWNTGTDTRAEFGGPYGSTSVWFANFLNVSVTDHAVGAAPRFYWHGSHTIGTFGSRALPADAYDPDVVMIENNTRICALIVYYSASAGGYCMTWSLFNTGGTPGFDPLATPMLIQAYSAPNDSLKCINIDADNDGNYAIAYQVGNQTHSKTGILPAGTTPVPTVPANNIIYSDHIQPDVSLQHSLVVPNMKVKVVGLRANRSTYKVAMRTLSSTPGPTVSSASFPAFSLNNPRIASPLNNTERFAITLMQNNPGSSTYDILFNAYTGTTSTSFKTLNTGAAGFPASIASYVNRLPAISYTEGIISVGWHTAFLPAPPSAQTNTFVGVDLQDGSFMPTLPTQYQDICPGLNYNPPSVISLSGRYTLWGKSAAYELINVSKQSSPELVWTIPNLGVGHWRPSQPGAPVKPETFEGFTVSPNPATDFLNLSAPRTDVQYSYFVFDLSGKKVSEGVLANGKAAVNVRHLAKGTYFIKIAGQGTSDLNTIKFVKQ